MSEFVRLIQQYLDRHGTRWAAFARNIGVSPQTVSKWKKNPGVFPEPEHLRRVAEVTGVPYLIVLDAVLKDAGYRESIVDDLPALKVRIARYVRSKRDHAWVEIDDHLNSRWFPDDYAFERELDLEPSEDEINKLIDGWIADADLAQYGNDDVFDQDAIRQYVSDRLRELWQEELERVYNEPVDRYAFMEALGLSYPHPEDESRRDEDEWWMDDVDTLARIYAKIIHVWGYREREFLEAFRESSTPWHRPATRTDYEAVYDRLVAQFEEEASAAKWERAQQQKTQNVTPIRSKPGPLPPTQLTKPGQKKAFKTVEDDLWGAAARKGDGPSVGRQIRDKHDREAEAVDGVDDGAGEESQDSGSDERGSD